MNQNKKIGRKELRLIKDELIELYTNQNLSTYQIAKMYDCCATTVKDILKENGVEFKSRSETSRKYNLDEHFFDKIDTEEKAYILGFLYADGCNSSNERTIKLEIEERDEEILKKMQKASNNLSPIRHIQRGLKKNLEEKRYSILNFNSKYMAKILLEKGVTQRKSLTLVFPDWLDKDLLCHFIRGYFDSDSSVSKSGNGLQCSIVSTIYFNTCLQNILKEFNIETKIVDACNNKITTTLRICKQDSVKKFLDYIYQDATIYLERKHNKYIKQYYKIINIGQNAKYSVKSNEMFIVSDIAEGVARGGLQTSYDTEYTVAASPKQIATYVDWYHVATGKQDWGYIVAKTGLSFATYIQARAIKVMASLITNAGDWGMGGYIANGFSDTNWVVTADNVKMANGGAKVYGLGTKTALMDILPDQTTTVNGFRYGEDSQIIKVGHLSLYKDVPLIELEQALLPNTVNGTPVRVVPENIIYLMPLGYYKPIKIVIEGNTLTVQKNPYETKDHTYQYIVTAHLGVDVVVGTKFGAIILD